MDEQYIDFFSIYIGVIVDGGLRLDATVSTRTVLAAANSAVYQ
jgi:hypothetical protein